MMVSARNRVDNFIKAAVIGKQLNILHDNQP